MGLIPGQGTKIPHILSGMGKKQYKQKGGCAELRILRARGYYAVSSAVLDFL